MRLAKSIFLYATICVATCVCPLWALATDGPPTHGLGIFVDRESNLFDPTSPDVERKLHSVISPRYGAVVEDEFGELRYRPSVDSASESDEFFLVTTKLDGSYEVYMGNYRSDGGEFSLMVPMQADITADAMGGSPPNSFTALLLTIPANQNAEARKIVIGIHSNVEPDAGFTEGHAWISIHDSDTEQTTCYGLWPDSHPNTPDNGDGTDVRVGMEDNHISKHSRYVEITPEQLEDFEDFADIVDARGYTHTCAEWATDAWLETSGEWIDPNDNFGFETPRMVSQSIKDLEANDPTSSGTPGSQGGNAGGQGGGTSCCGGK